MVDELIDRSLSNAHKVAFLCGAYPEKKITEVDKDGNDIGISGMFQLAIIEFNTAVWRAEDLNLIEVSKTKSKDVRVDQIPEKWIFDEDVKILLQDIPYVLQKFAESESDIEENYLMNWVTGFPTQDVFVALKKLIADGVMATYELVNKTEVEPSKKGLKRGKKTKIVEDTYTFYTLAGNEKYQWGRKQFADPDKLKK